MSATTRSAIIVALADFFETEITTANGYFTQPLRITTQSIDPQSYEGDFPILAIDGSGQEIYDDAQPVQFLTRFLPVTVYYWDHPSDPDGNIDEFADKMLSDLERAINTDWTLGGACLRCRLARNQVLTHQGKQTCAAVLELVIQYRTPFNPPT